MLSDLPSWLSLWPNKLPNRLLLLLKLKLPLLKLPLPLPVLLSQLLLQAKRNSRPLLKPRQLQLLHSKQKSINYSLTLLTDLALLRSMQVISRALLKKLTNLLLQVSIAPLLTISLLQSSRLRTLIKMMMVSPTQPIQMMTTMAPPIPKMPMTIMMESLMLLRALSTTSLAHLVISWTKLSLEMPV